MAGFSDKRQFFSRYKVTDTVLGEGTYGTVIMAVEKSSGQVVAMKNVKWDSSDGRSEHHHSRGCSSQNDLA